MSSCTKSDPNGTSSFNKDIVMELALARAADQKLPVINDVSETQKMKLHGDDLLTSVVAEKGEGLAQQHLVYFVSEPTGTNYLSGGGESSGGNR
jgi:hypothetical protein